MARTLIDPNTQLPAGSLRRALMNTTTAGSAVITKVVAGYGVSLSSTGADAGTGDVTVGSLVPATSGPPASLAAGQLALDGAAAMLYWRDSNGVTHAKSLNPEGGDGPALSLGDFVASGAVGSAAATVDQYSSIRVAQTTAGVSLSLPAPTLSGSYVHVRVVNTGTAAFTMTYVVPPGCQMTLLWNPALSAWTRATEVAPGLLRAQAWAPGLFVQPGDLVTSGDVLYAYTGAAAVVTAAPVTGPLWYPQGPVSAGWYTTAALTVPNGTATPLSMSTLGSTTDGSFPMVLGTGTVTVPVDGIYQFRAQLFWPATSASGQRLLGFVHNGSLADLSYATQGANVCKHWNQLCTYCAAGDTVYAVANQTSGGSLTTFVSGLASCSRFEVTLMSPQ